MSIRLTLGADDAGRRIDRLLRKRLVDLPLSAIHRLLRTGKVRVDGKKAKAEDRPLEGSILELPDLDGLGKEVAEARPSKPGTEGKLDIVWEGDDLLVLSKGEGSLVHGPESLELRVRAYLSGKLRPSLSFKPGPLHRLDRGTSGIIVFSKTLDGARLFSEALRGRGIRKRYLALLDGILASEEYWEDELARDSDGRRTDILPQHRAEDAEGPGGAGKTAVSRAVPIATAGNRTLALIEIGTGRTHQIRAQASSRGFPLAGDAKYGGSKGGGAFLLHAYEIAAPADGVLPLPPLLVARPSERFLRAVEANFGRRIAEMLEAALPTDRILDAIM